MHQKNDEISFYDMYLNLLKGFNKSWKLIAGIAFLICGLSFGYHKNQKKYYQQDIIIKSVYLKTSDISYLFENLKDLVKKKNYSQIKNTLGIEIEDAKLIKGFDYEVFSASSEQSGAILSTYFYKGVECNTLKMAIEKYLNEIEYVQSLSKSNSEKYKSFIVSIDDELKVLETTFKGAELELDNVKGFVKKSEIVISLKEKREEALYFLKTDLPFIIVQSFCDNENKAGPSLLINVSISVLSFIILSGITILFVAGLQND